MDYDSERVFDQPDYTDFKDILMACILCTLVILIFCFISTRLIHWFLIPVWLCGVIISVDGIKWFRKKYDIYDPKGVMGVFGIYLFLFDPLLSALYDQEIINAPTPPDWRYWIGRFFIWQTLGLILYQVVHHISFKKPSKASRTYWALNPGAATSILPLILFVVLGAHLYFMFRMGGIQGFLSKATYGTGGGDVRGLGPLMVFGRSFPILLLIGLTVIKYRTLSRTTYFSTVFFLMLFMGVIILLFYGLDTSRSTLVWGMVWVIGIIHLFWRRIMMKWVLVSMIPFVGFMYIYGFYKNVGTQVFQLFTGEVTLKSLEASTGRTMEGLLVGDFGRSRVQASMLYTLKGIDQGYRYRLGSTYLTSIVPLVPRRVWPSKPTDSGKVIAATELFKGEGTYRGHKDEYRSTRIFALPGEALLNFGVLGIPLAYAVFGYITARVRRRMLSYYAGDMRLLTAPFLTILLLLILTHDSSNVTMQALFNWALPALTVFLCSQKIPVSPETIDMAIYSETMEMS